MTDNDDLPKVRQGPPPTNLDTLSVHELEAHIAALQAEIDRARAMITKKEAAKTAASGFFKS